MPWVALEPLPPAGRFILIVEDHADGRESLRRLLELYGHHVEVARDGVEGVEKALASPPEVAVVDIGLPRLDGYQVARRIREALGRRVLLIAHTGYSQPAERQRALEAGFDVFLAKPLDPQELADWLARGACG
jgi:CheY-like chemotaxis protein